MDLRMDIDHFGMDCETCEVMTNVEEPVSIIETKESTYVSKELVSIAEKASKSFTMNEINGEASTSSEPNVIAEKATMDGVVEEATTSSGPVEISEGATTSYEPVNIAEEAATSSEPVKVSERVISPYKIVGVASTSREPVRTAQEATTSSASYQMVGAASRSYDMDYASTSFDMHYAGTFEYEYASTPASPENNHPLNPNEVQPAEARIFEELIDWDYNPIMNFTVNPVVRVDGSYDLHRWMCSVPGLPGTMWENGVYGFMMIFGCNYPMEPPTVIFNPPIYHPNVAEDGNLKTSLICNDGMWRPYFGVREVLWDVQNILNSPETICTVNQDAMDMMIYDIDQYERLVMQQVTFRATNIPE